MAVQQFTNRVLDALDRIYGIVGSIARVNHIDVAPPVLVHDVSAEAEIASGFWTTVRVAVNTAGAGANTFSTVSRTAMLQQAAIAAELLQRSLESAEVDVWFYALWGFVAAADVGNFSSMRAGITLGNQGGGDTIPLAIWDTVDTVPLINGGNHFVRTSAAAATYVPIPRLPMLVPDSPPANPSRFVVEANDDAGGAMTAEADFRVWIGAKGAPPPLA